MTNRLDKEKRARIKRALRLREKRCRCDGKGYGTSFTGTESYFHREIGVKIIMCDCPRADQLKKYFTIKKQYRNTI